GLGRKSFCGLLSNRAVILPRSLHYAAGAHKPSARKNRRSGRDEKFRRRAIRQVQSIISSTILATWAAMAGAAVRPGDSMPTRGVAWGAEGGRAVSKSAAR